MDKTLYHNYTIIMTNNISGCSDDFHVEFQNLENLYDKHFEGKTAYLLFCKLLK